MAITAQPTKVISGTPTIVQGSAQVTSFVNNSFTSDTNGGIQFPLQQGVPMQATYLYTVIPAENNQTCVVTTVGATTSGYLTLNAVGTTTTGNYVNNVTTAVTYYGQPIILPSTTVSDVVTFPGITSPGFTGGACIQLDCERCLSFNFASHATQACYITIGGWDYRGVAVSEQLTINSSSNLGVYSSQMYSIIGFIYVSSSTTGAVFTVGSGSNIGLPYACPNPGNLINVSWNNESYEDQLVIGNPWRSATDGTANNAPSLTTATSARGCIVAPTTPDGNIQLSVYYLVYGADSETNTNIANLNPSALAQYYVSTNVGGTYVWPYLVPQDLVGMQYPGDNAAFTAYTTSLAITTAA
jgi:hypothetical protein